MNSKQTYIFFVLLLSIIIVFPAIAQRSWVKWDPADGVSVRQGFHVEWFRGGESTLDRGSEEVAILWSDTRNGDRGTYIEILNADLELEFGPGGMLIADASGRQEDPGVWPSSDGGWFIAWEDFEVDTLGNIYCTKLDENLEPVEGWNRRDGRGVPVCLADRIQEDVRIVDDGDGGCIIAWKDGRNFDNGDLYAMHVLPDGRLDPRWPLNGRAIVREEGGQTSHTADTDGSGGMIIGWCDERDERQDDIWAQRINPIGELLWGEGIRVCVNQANQETPKLCPDGAGGAFFSWVDERNWGQTLKDIYVQHVNSAGELLWDDAGEVLCEQPQEQTDNRIVASRPGEAIVAWLDKRNNPNSYDIYSMRISGNNALRKEWNPSSGVGIVVETEQGQQWEQTGVRLFPDGQGGAYYVWEDERDGNAVEVDIWAHHINLNGSPVWEDNGIPICQASSTQWSAFVRRAANGGAFFVWADARDGSLAIYGQLVAFNGDLVWEEDGVLIQPGFDGNAKAPILLPRYNGHYTVVWLDGRSGSGLGVPYIQHFFEEPGEDEVEFVLDSNGVPVIIMPEDVIGSADLVDAVNDEGTGTFVVWEDHRQGQLHSIYAQHMDAEGNRLWGDEGLKLANWSSEQFAPKVCYDGEGGIIVAWRSPTPNDYSNLFMQRVSGEGELLWGDWDDLRLTFNELDQWVEALIQDQHNGGAVIVWRTDTGDGEFVDDLWYTRVDLDMNIMWDDGEGWKVLCDEVGYQRNVSLIHHQNGYVAAWVDERDQEENQTDIMGQFIEMDGSTRWLEDGFWICDEISNQERPILTIDNQTRIWCVWEDWRNMRFDWGVDLYMQKISARADHRGWPEVYFGREGARVCTEPTNQVWPAIAHDGRNGMWIVWEDNRNGLWSDIYGSHFQSNGNLYGAPWVDNGNLICGAFHRQNKPKVARLMNHGGTGAVGVWEDKRCTGKEELFAVYTQRIDDGSVSVGSEETISQPTDYALEGVYPNPFNAQTFLKFTTATAGVVSISLYDVNGRMVTTLSDGFRNAGHHQVLMDARRLSSGVYIVRLEAGDVQLETKMQLIK